MSMFAESLVHRRVPQLVEAALGNKCTSVSPTGQQTARCSNPILLESVMMDSFPMPFTLPVCEGEHPGGPENCTCEGSSAGRAGVTHTVRLPDGHVISDDRARLDMAFVHDALAGAYWAAGRPCWLTERSWANCLCFGIYAADGEMVGFGRVLTDYALRAHLGDVFVRPASRGSGLGRALIETVLAHPELVTVLNWTLTTRDAHALYARYGFRSGQAGGDWMTLDRSLAGNAPT